MASYRQTTLKTLAKSTESDNSEEARVKKKEEHLQKLRAASERIKGLKRKVRVSAATPGAVSKDEESTSVLPTDRRPSAFHHCTFSVESTNRQPFSDSEHDYRVRFRFSVAHVSF